MAQNVAQDYARSTRINAGARGQARAESLVPDGPTAPEAQDFLRTARGEAASLQYADPYATPITEAGGSAANRSFDLPQNVRSVLQDGDGARAIGWALRGAQARQDAATIRELNALRTGDTSVPVTAATLDKVRMAFREMAGQAAKANRNSVASGFMMRKDMLDTVLDAVPQLREARANYKDMSGAIEAVDLGQTARTAMPSNFVPTVENMSPLQQQAARVGFRQALIDAYGNKGQAPRLNEELSWEQNLGKNTEALFGPEEQQRLSDFGTNESIRLDRAAQIAPNTGSQTVPRGQDLVQTAGEMAKVGGKMLRMDVPGAAWEAARLWLVRRGMSEQDAETLVRLSTDPAKVGDAERLLAERIGREPAADFMRQLSAATARGAVAGLLSQPPRQDTPRQSSAPQ